MRLTTSFFRGICIVCTLVTPVRSAEPTPPAANESAEIQRWIKDLGDSRYRVRLAAGRALEERGEAALPWLRLSAQHPDEEVRRRIEVLTEQIQKSVLLSPKRVSIHVVNSPVSDVLKDITRQTGYPFQYSGGNDARHRVTLALDRVPYWEAIDRICSQAGLSFNIDDQRGHLHLYQQNTVSPYVSYDGPFRIVAMSINYHRFVNLANIPRNGQDANGQDNMGFSFFVQAEPKAPLLQLNRIRLVKAEDENGGSLLPRFQPENNPFAAHYHDYNTYRSFQHSANTTMNKPNKDSVKAKVLRGKAMVQMVAVVKPEITVDALVVGKKKQSFTGETVQVDVDEVAEQNGQYSITLNIKRLGKVPENDYNWPNTLQQKLELLDDQGRKFQFNGVANYLGNSPLNVHAVFQFGAPGNEKIGKAKKLLLNQWVPMSHEIEFEFRDVPLP